MNKSDTVMDGDSLLFAMAGRFGQKVCVFKSRHLLVSHRVPVVYLYGTGLTLPQSKTYSSTLQNPPPHPLPETLVLVHFSQRTVFTLQ